MTGIICAGVWVLLATGPEVAVIKSSDITAYNDALAGVKEGVGGAAVQEYSMGSEGADTTVAHVLAQSPKIVVAIGAKAGEACAKGLHGIPLVFTMIMDPDKYGLRKKTVAGVSMEMSVEAQFAYFHSVVPGAKRIGVLYDPERSKKIVQEGSRQAGKIGLELVGKAVQSRDEVAQSLSGIIGDIDGLWMIPDPTVVSEDSFRYILTATVEKKIPLLAYSEAFVKGGAILALFPDHKEMGREAGILARRVLEGEEIGKIGQVRPKGVKAINLSAAKLLGVTIPGDVLQNARTY